MRVLRLQFPFLPPPAGKASLKRQPLVWKFQTKKIHNFLSHCHSISVNRLLKTGEILKSLRNTNLVKNKTITTKQQ
ncbi:hypothetical protein [Chlamydia felis Fe/C-56]|uniref:Uncharacterized protein n=1 Tax=Chlamydia felis (strain Fe/C-56) TaxID=264202 RepID=Q253Q4_CHLFF|nr:hypothetical protein [Chlamydia felis Fe/C-56]